MGTMRDSLGRMLEQTEKGLSNRPGAAPFSAETSRCSHRVIVSLVMVHLGAAAFLFTILGSGREEFGAGVTGIVAMLPGRLGSVAALQGNAGDPRVLLRWPCCIATIGLASWGVGYLSCFVLLKAWRQDAAWLYAWLPVDVLWPPSRRLIIVYMAVLVDIGVFVVMLGSIILRSL